MLCKCEYITSIQWGFLRFDCKCVSVALHCILIIYFYFHHPQNCLQFIVLDKTHWTMAHLANLSIAEAFTNRWHQIASLGHSVLIFRQSLYWKFLAGRNQVSNHSWAGLPKYLVMEQKQLRTFCLNKIYVYSTY